LTIAREREKILLVKQAAQIPYIQEMSIKDIIYYSDIFIDISKTEENEAKKLNVQTQQLNKSLKK